MRNSYRTMGSKGHVFNLKNIQLEKLYPSTPNVFDTLTPKTGVEISEERESSVCICLVTALCWRLCAKYFT